MDESKEENGSSAPDVELVLALERLEALTKKVREWPADRRAGLLSAVLDLLHAVLGSERTSDSCGFPADLEEWRSDLLSDIGER